MTTDKIPNFEQNHIRYRALGNSGLMVSELCLGTMTFGGDEDIWGLIGQLRQEQADELVRIALQAGINFIDTANIYGLGASELIVGQSLKNLGVRREDVVLATKVLGPMGEGPNARGASRGHIMNECKASLSRLQTDYIDLYQIHGFDPATPIEETLEALNTLVQQGYVRYVGLSNWAAWQVMKAIGISQARNLCPVTSLQAYYTLVGRELEREVIPMLLIVVTAQKREQEITDVPMAMSAYSGEFLEKIGGSELNRVAELTPGFVIQLQDRFAPGFSIRGITTNDINPESELRVAIFQDGVAVTHATASYGELFDIDRIEVEKGPQSTLHGRSALNGGAEFTVNF